MSQKVQAEVVALVPMRHQSLRVTGKNYRHLGGVPLFHHILRTLERCSGISRVVIDTDSDVIRENVRTNFPNVTLIERPEHLRGDKVPMTEILYHDAGQVAAECYLQTHSTNPFLRAETIEAALATWREARHAHDSLFSVTRLQARLWDDKIRPINHDPRVLLRTQDLPPIYLENSNFYIFTPDLIMSTRRRIGDRPKLFEIDPLEALDIDDEQAFALAEQLMMVNAEWKTR
jgi:CMP-N-acetylneuraminic acid synthetase